MDTPSYKLEILTPAMRELEEIALVHLALVDIESARRITDRILDALEHLKRFPHTGVAFKQKPLRLEGYRMFICGHYLCVYRLMGETVFVYHIVDGRTNYPRLLANLPKGEA